VVNSTGDVHAFVATPVEAAGATASDLPAVESVARPRPIPEGARTLVRKWMGTRGW